MNARSQVFEIAVEPRQVEEAVARFESFILDGLKFLTALFRETISDMCFALISRDAIL